MKSVINFVRDAINRYPFSVLLVGMLLIASAFHSCTVKASDLPCAKEERHAERVCKQKGEDSLQCENARARYERCMDEVDPIGGIVSC